ncbi:hypothetical protein AMTRI_Chr01g114350 [Amborella trichopoda]
MAALVARGSQFSSSISVQDKGSRNKRKFRADPPLISCTDCPSSQAECPKYEFLVNQNLSNPLFEKNASCDFCNFNQCQLESTSCPSQIFDSSSAIQGSTMDYGGHLQPPIHGDEHEVVELQDADWNDITEGHLEELVLGNLDTIYRSAIKKIVACGFTEEVATRAVLRYGRCYGPKDTVSNIVDNTLAFLRNEQENDPKDPFFEDLQQLEKYILAEMVCVLREVRPFFSTGDAMWCLLICDMNVDHACAMDGDALDGFGNDGLSENPSGSTSSQSKPETNDLESVGLNNLNPNQSNPGVEDAQASQPTLPVVTGIPNLPSGRISFSSNASSNLGGMKSPRAIEALDTENTNSCCSQAPRKLKSESEDCKRSQSFRDEEKVSSEPTRLETIRRTHINSLKVLRQKSSALVERSNRTNGPRLSLKKGKASISSEGRTFSSSDSISERKSTTSRDTSFRPNNSITLETNSTKVEGASCFPLDKTDLSLSVLSKNRETCELNCHTSKNNDSDSNYYYPNIGPDQMLRNPNDKKDELIIKMVQRVRELQGQLQEWTEWAQQKVMQAACRLSKDKAELKSLRQEKEEAARLKRDKQTLEENTMKKLSEMENALCKAGGQVERANAAVRRLEVENKELRQEMESAKLRAAESAASCQEVSRREQRTLKKFQTWERQKALFQEELATEKKKLSLLQQQLVQAKEFQAQLEGRWKQEEKAKEEALMRVKCEREELERLEAIAKTKEDQIRSKAESDFQSYRDDIQRLEREIAELRLQTDSSKIAALRWGIDRSFSSKWTESCGTQVSKEASSHILTEIANYNVSPIGDIQQERECVMCLTEEMSVVFLPCAHQVVCTKCNELHEKQGMKDCPSCRTPILRRLCVRSADS